MSDDRLEILMVKVVDDVATLAEREELMHGLQSRPDLRMELDAHSALKATTDRLIERLELDHVSDLHRASAGNRAETALGWVLFLAGLALILGYVVYHFVNTPDIPAPLRVGIAAMSMGGMVLLISALRGRLAERPHDRYSEVIR